MENGERRPVVFISSTCEDLKKTGHRDAARDGANRAGFCAEMQEYFAAKDNPPLKECLERVEGTVACPQIMCQLELES